MNVLLLLALASLACYRITRLIVDDTFPPALWLRNKLAGDERGQGRWSWSPDWLAKLVTCPWCVSVWVAGGLVLIIDVTQGLPVPWLAWPAVAAVSAWLSHLEYYFEREE